MTAPCTRVKFADRTIAADAPADRQQDDGDRAERQPCADGQRRERIDDQHADQREPERMAERQLAPRSQRAAKYMHSMISVRCVGTDSPASSE